MGSNLKKAAVWQNSYMCSCPYLLSVIKVRLTYAKDTLFNGKNNMSLLCFFVFFVLI